ncbi:MAG: fumarylacetoacetate hydrolase family protein [Bacteroidetes bacterium]|nr:fumarylacetoacetate hydrolase family protein [Bacteroidota bacterium]MBU1484594.1 fumarylacetoacetate hydrolase family protein [Bacteroidota bacterium]MBU1759495.1 fumarylacetoacetate hydrolase family protein [Bacteroidota bacterium]MBU2045645.1 fumarylacetoacetate hydrolase family protein [Bacteroidota bacterium]MBU2267710.1 fumarylacetoacetate hydrolase family protein [Bacteroidota bacterium]
MKIIAIGRNYAEHAKELNNPLPQKPVLFLKPDTAVLKDNKPFYHPNFSNDIHHEIEVILKISKEGKLIQEKFAHKYYDEIGLGIDFTARDLQSEQKAKGLPWEIAKAFDHSAPISQFISKLEFKDLNTLDFKLFVNEELKQQGNTCDMIFNFDQIITYASQFFTLKKGDLIFTGTPAGVGQVKIGDQLKGYLNNQDLLNFEIK